MCLWIEKCPAVSNWMFSVMGKSINGVYTVEQFWEEYATSTIPFLKEEFFLIGRDKEKEIISSWLTEKKWMPCFESRIRFRGNNVFNCYNL